jgi:GntR family transcriptional regulator
VSPTDQLIGDLFRSARKFGVPLSAVRTRLRQWLELQPPDHFLLIEPDEELRRIVALEMQQALTFPVKSCDLSMTSLTDAVQSAIVVALPSKVEVVRKNLSPGAELLTLQVRSVPTSLAGWLPAPSDALVGIASRWDNFLKLGRTLLIASGFQPDTLIFRDAKKVDWRRGLEQVAAVVCDLATAAEVPKSTRVIVFPVLSESSLAELRRHEMFIRDPLGL